MSGTQSFNDMYWKTKVKVEAEFREAEERQAKARLERAKFLHEVFGSDDIQTWLAPSPVVDLDAALAEHFAQLHKAVRYVLADAIDDGTTAERRNLAQSAVTRMIQTSLAIAKVLKAPPPRSFDFRMTVEHKGAPAPTISKTVRGGEQEKDAQD